MARVVTCSCKRSYVVAETLAGSSFPCECRHTIELPSLSKLRHFEEVPEPKNCSFQLVDNETRSLDNIDYLRIKFEDAYAVLKQTRSTGLVMELLNEHQLPLLQVESVFAKLDKDIRHARANSARVKIIAGLISIPFIAFAFIVSVLIINPRAMLLFGLALFTLLGMLITGIKQYSLSKLPNKP